MYQIDHTGRVLVQQLAEREPDPLYRSSFGVVAPTAGTDPSGAIRITIDAARRVLRVDVLDVDALRVPGRLASAFRRAFADADARRGVAALERHGRLEEFKERAGDRPQPAVAPPAPDVSHDARRRRRLGGPAATAATAATATPLRARTSSNGHVTVRRGPDLRPRAVVADPDWLAAAQPHHLEQALVDACSLTEGAAP